MAKEIFRNSSCISCIHAVSMRKTEAYCDELDKYISCSSASTCELYYAFRKRKFDTINGYMIKSYQTDDYRTEKQWLKSGYVLKKGAEGILMYSSPKAAQIDKDNLTTYYSISEVERINND